MNVKCTVQYDGTRYFGFQRQPEGHPTIQQMLEDAIYVLTDESTRVVGAGRTDAGVHAHGQVIQFHTRSRIPLDRWPYALNSRLPPDIVVTKAQEAPAHFHARFDARLKTYRYTVWNGPLPSPFWRPYAWWVRRPLSVAAMQEAAAYLEGRHDFAAFRAAGSSVRTSTRTLSLLRVDSGEAVNGPDEPEGARLVHVWAEADGFLYHMVRNLVGTLVSVGLGEREPSWVVRVLHGRRREAAGPTAPPHGLTLWRVVYDEQVSSAEFDAEKGSADCSTKP